jgi:hypothetical protein
MPVIRIKNNTGTTTPSSLKQGEISVTIGTPNMHVGNAAQTPVKIVGSLAKQTANNVAITGGAINNTSVSASSLTASQLTLNSGVSATAIDNTSYSSGTGLMSTSSSTIVTQNATKTHVDAFGATVLKNVYTFTGNGTYTKSGSDVKYVRVCLVGGGGGARCQHESGGAGGYAEGFFDVSGVSTVSVTVGGGSGGGGYYGNSGQGGTTSFGGYLSASGGHGANQNQAHSGGHGGFGYGGSINSAGGGGTGHAIGQNNPNNGSSGIGGQSFFGGGNNGVHSNWGFGDPGAGYGSGGGSTSGNGHNGNAGRDGKVGICIVYEFK